MSNKLLRRAWDHAPHDLRGPAWTLYIWFCDRATDTRKWVTSADVADMERGLHASNARARAAMHVLMARGLIVRLTPRGMRGKAQWSVYPADRPYEQDRTPLENEQCRLLECEQSDAHDRSKTSSDDTDALDTARKRAVYRSKTSSVLLENEQSVLYVSQLVPVSTDSHAHERAVQATTENAEADSEPPPLRGAPPTVGDIPEGWKGGGLTSAMAWARSAYGRKYLAGMGKTPQRGAINADYRTSDVIVGYRRWCDEMHVAYSV